MHSHSRHAVILPARHMPAVAEAALDGLAETSSFLCITAENNDTVVVHALIRSDARALLLGLLRNLAETAPNAMVTLRPEHEQDEVVSGQNRIPDDTRTEPTVPPVHGTVAVEEVALTAPPIFNPTEPAITAGVPVPAASPAASSASIPPGPTPQDDALPRSQSDIRPHRRGRPPIVGPRDEHNARMPLYRQMQRERQTMRDILKTIPVTVRPMSAGHLRVAEWRR